MITEIISQECRESLYELKQVLDELANLEQKLDKFGITIAIDNSNLIIPNE